MTEGNARRVAELEAAVAEQVQIIQALEDELGERVTELAKVKGYQAELAERCYRKDLELDAWRTGERPAADA